jgi:hypothetical protein
MLFPAAFAKSSIFQKGIFGGTFKNRKKPQFQAKIRNTPPLVSI